MAKNTVDVTESEVDSVTPHSMPVSVLLHLLPGFASLPFHLLIVGHVQELGWPVAFSWHVVTSVLCFLPMMMAVLLFEAKKRGNVGFSLEGVVVYRRRMQIRRYLGWTVAILLTTALIFAVLQPVTDFLAGWFTWLPNTTYNYEGTFPTAVLAVSFALNLLVTGIAVPIVEELYYRGYLLPRMPEAFGRSAPVAHSVLFAIHHVHSAWMLPVRAIGLLPLIYVTRYTRSLVPAMFAHSAVNLTDAIQGAFERFD